MLEKIIVDKNLEEIFEMVIKVELVKEDIGFKLLVKMNCM